MKKVWSLITWLVVFQLVCYGMGMITSANMDPWYKSLHLSVLTPPGYVFGIVWGALYGVLAIVGWLLSQACDGLAKRLQIVFGMQIVLNWLWTPLFFYAHWVSAAFVCLLVMVLLTSYILILSMKKDRRVFGLILPYWCWLCFAAYLNGFTVFSN